jgi:hypothetical protein
VCSLWSVTYFHVSFIATLSVQAKSSIRCRMEDGSHLMIPVTSNESGILHMQLCVACSLLLQVRLGNALWIYCRTCMEICITSQRPQTAWKLRAVMFYVKHQAVFIVTMNEPSTFRKSPAPWCRILLDKPVVLQLVNKFSVFYETGMCITVFTRYRHWTLSWGRWIQTTLLKTISVFFNIILSSVSMFLGGFTTSGF